LPPLPRSSVPEWTTTVRYETVSIDLCKSHCQAYTDNALGANQFDELVGGRAFPVALGIGLEVAKITNMANLVLGCAVCLAMRVDYHPSSA
jgi:hypothetical protein